MNVSETYELVEELAAKVLELQGCKAVELIGKLGAYKPTIIWPDILKEAILAGKVVEIEYTLPNMNYRVKSFILPGGTEVRGQDST